MIARNRQIDTIERVKQQARDAVNRSNECEPDHHWHGKWLSDEHKLFRYWYCQYFADTVRSELNE